MKKAVLILLTAAVLCAFVVPGGEYPALAQSAQYQTEDEELIFNYFRTISEKDYEANFELHCEEQRAVLRSVAQQNARERMGMWSVSSVDLGSAAILADVTGSPHVEERGGENSRNTARTYLVKCGMTVYQDTPYYFEGNNYLVITVDGEGGARRIFNDTLAAPELVLKYEEREADKKYFGRRFTEERGGYGPILSDGTKIGSTHSGTMPSTIRVRRKSLGNRIDRVNFKTYCKVVACAEVGYSSSGHANYHKSSILAVKNYGWWRVLNPRNASSGFDIEDNQDDQIYNPEKHNISSSSYSRLMGHVNDVWNVIMVNSEKKVFKAMYATGNSTNHTYQHRGRLYHYGAKVFAEQGRGYKWILEYYYSYSSRNDSDNSYYPASSGAIIVCSSHSGGSVIGKTAASHTRRCASCSYHYKQNHSWQAQGHQMYCTVCNFTVTASRQPNALMK